MSAKVMQQTAVREDRKHRRPARKSRMADFDDVGTPELWHVMRRDARRERRAA